MKGSEEKCHHCKKNYIKKWHKKQKYCSQECAKLFYKKNFEKNNIRLPISSSSAGAIGELRISIDLLARGFHVFRNLSPSGWCDLVINNNKECFTVEVTTGYYNSQMKVIHPKTSKIKEKKWDILAIAMSTGEIFYEPSLPDLK